MSSPGEKRNQSEGTEAQAKTKRKIQRQPPFDAQWCLENVGKLDLKSFALHIGLTDKTKALTRYRNIIRKWINDDATKKKLLSDLKTWLATVDSTAFWQEQSRTRTLANSRAACSAFVDKMITEETPNAQTPLNDKVDQVGNMEEEDEESEGDASAASNKDMTDLFQKYCEHIDTIKRPLYLESSLKELLAVAGILFLAPMDHSPEMIKVFGQKTLDNACKEVLDELIPANTPKISDKEFLEVTKTINSVDNKEISVRDAKRDLLRLASTINSTIGNVVEGLANLLTKLPRLPILDMGKIGEVELQATYFDVFLSEIIADQDRRICLRWSNRSVNEDITDMRPDAIISTLVQHEFGCPVGFGETKNGNASKQAVNLDVFRLGVASKRALDLHGLPACLAFMIKGYHISFFIVSKHKDTPFYTMMEIAALDFASSISDLHTFASRRNLDLLAGVSDCFWTTCTDDLTMNTQTNALDDLVPIGDYLLLMAKSSKGTLGHSYRY